MAINYNNCLKAARGGVACKSLLQLAKQAGVELPIRLQPPHRIRGDKVVKAKKAKRPNGQKWAKAEKIAKNGFLAKEWPNGHLAFLAFREGYTFSDKIAPTYWSSFCRGILDSQTDTVGCDKMMLGIPNNISGLPRRSYFSIRSGFASKKGGGDQLSSKQLLRPLKSVRQDVLATYGIARQRISAHGACRNFVIRKRYEGIRLEGRCSEAAPRLLRGCSTVSLIRG